MNCLKKNMILKAITGIAFLVLLISMMFFEVVELKHIWIPAIPYFISLTWLYLFGVANTPKRKR